jgi:hypothetical protein
MTQDSKLDIYDHVGHQRWLIDNGFINDLHKDNLYMYGAIVHKDIQAVELQIDREKKLVTYILFVPTKLLNKINKYDMLAKRIKAALDSGSSASIIDLWVFKRMIKKEGNLDFNHLINRFVKDYCGPKWKAEVEVKDLSLYEEGYKEQDVIASGSNPGVDKRNDSR